MLIRGVSRERIQNARPDCIRDVGQLVAGQVVIEYWTYIDLNGHIAQHSSELAVVRGAPYRIIDDGIKNTRLGEAMRVEKLPAFTQEQTSSVYTVEPQSMLSVRCMGIDGVDDLEPFAGIHKGLLAVQEEPYQVHKNLEVGPGLYVNGSNDYDMVFHAGFMIIALDSDPRIAGQVSP